MSERRLVSLRRYVPDPGDRPAYDQAWLRLHTAATARGAHAWRFASADRPGAFLEFLEFGPESDIRADPGTLGAIKSLYEEFGQVPPTALIMEEWVEAPVLSASPPPPPASPDDERFGFGGADGPWLPPAPGEEIP